MSNDWTLPIVNWWLWFTGGGGWPYIASTVLTFAFAAFYLWNEVRLIRRGKGKRPPLAPQEAKRRAKRENERIKLTSTFLNSIGIAIMFAMVVTPVFRTMGETPEPLAWGQTLVGVALSFGFHLFGLWNLVRWRSEEW